IAAENDHAQQIERAIPLSGFDIDLTQHSLCRRTLHAASSPSLSLTTQMLIEWVNHAGFVLQTGDLRILCDPCLEVTAFNNGWRLLSPTVFQYEDFSAITYIWFSHEHPDHFSPPSLKRIPEKYRKKITILFRETKDKRVINACRQFGFQVVELPVGPPFDL